MTFFSFQDCSAPFALTFHTDAISDAPKENHIFLDKHVYSFSFLFAFIESEVLNLL
jgi:hypothetical protein